MLSLRVWVAMAARLPPLIQREWQICRSEFGRLTVLCMRLNNNNITIIIVFRQVDYIIFIVSLLPLLFNSF